MIKKNQSKQGICVGLEPENYIVKDLRLNKPICHQKYEKGEKVGSCLIQDANEINLHGNKLSYFSPNNIGVLLSISNSYADKAEIIFNEKIIKDLSVYDKSVIDKIQYLNQTSTVVCDYIELIQIAIVFGYTCLETFTNLSIPEDYIFKKNNKSKGISELYDKSAIERWIT